MQLFKIYHVMHQYILHNLHFWCNNESKPLMIPILTIFVHLLDYLIVYKKEKTEEI